MIVEFSIMGTIENINNIDNNNTINSNDIHNNKHKHKHPWKHLIMRDEVETRYDALGGLNKLRV